MTNLREVVAYVLAHAAGLAWGFLVNPLIFRSLLAQGYRGHLLLTAIALGIAVSLVVLLLFLVLRKVMANEPVKFTDGPEIAAYVVAHGLGIAWNSTVTPLIFRSLIAEGYRNLVLPGFALSVTVSIVVLLIFLFLRKVIRAN
jgi:hypothetical protein